MIIPKFIIDQSIINAEIRVINSLLSQQRQLKQTLILYLEKISEGILNANDDQDSTSLVSCLNGIKMSFENIKGNIDTLLDLRAFLEESSKLSAYDSKYFEKYNEDYIKIFEKISEDNIFYYTFMESILKYMSVVFEEAPPAKEKPIIEDTKDDIKETDEEVIETYDFNLKDMVAEELLKETNLLEEFAAIAQATLEQFEEIQEKESSTNIEINDNDNDNDITSVIEIKDNIYLEDTIIDDNLTVDEPAEEESKKEEEKLFSTVSLEELENNFDTIYENSNESNNDLEKETFFDDTISIEEPNEPSFIPEDISTDESTNKIEEELEEELNKILINDKKSNKKHSSKKNKNKKKQKDYTVIDDEEENISNSNVELDPFKEKILLFSEKNNNIILPFSTEDLEEFFTSNPSKYTSMQDIIDKEYTLPYDIFKNPASARFKETYYLAKHKSNLSVSKATALASELYFNSQVDPVIIRACKNIDELYSYLACLERNHLDEFKHFKIIYN